MKKKLNISSIILLVLITSNILVSCDKNDDPGVTAQDMEETAGEAGGEVLKEKKDIRFWEHHNFNIDPIGGESGYDFVNMDHFPIFENFMSVGPEKRKNIDMHETSVRNSSNTGLSGFGFTSAVVDGEGGNNTTKYMIAPTGFDYDAINTAGEISNVFNEAQSTKTIAPVSVGAIYLGHIRDSDLYVAIRITDALLSGTFEEGKVFFDFDYKYGNIN